MTLQDFIKAYNAVYNQIKLTYLYEYIFHPKLGLMDESGVSPTSPPRSIEIVNNMMEIPENINKLLLAHVEETKARKLLYRQQTVKMAREENRINELRSGDESSSALSKKYKKAADKFSQEAQANANRLVPIDPRTGSPSGVTVGGPIIDEEGNIY